MRVGAALLSQEHVPKVGPVQVAAATELPESNRHLHSESVVLNLQQVVRCVRRATVPVPAAGVEPAAFAFSARRSNRLSYTGIDLPPSPLYAGAREVKQRRRQESNLRQAGLQPAAGAVRSDVFESQRWESNPHTPPYESGARPFELHWRLAGWPVGVEPTQPRFTAGSRYHFGFGHSIPVRS